MWANVYSLNANYAVIGKSLILQVMQNLEYWSPTRRILSVSEKTSNTHGVYDRLFQLEFQSYVLHQTYC